ncbi:MAG: hypothetical protein ACRDJ4_01525 [Actinomycetota bacterium]
MAGGHRGSANARVGLRALSFLGVASLGLLAGHAADYVLVAPGAARRSALLAGSGHGYLETAWVVLAALAIVSAVTAFGLGYARRPSRRSGARFPLGAVWIALVQALGFVLLEAAERLLSGSSLHDHLGSILLVGVPLQLAFGIVGGLVLFALERVGERVGRAVSPRRMLRRKPEASRPAAELLAPRSALVGPFRVRGPPLRMT